MLDAILNKIGLYRKSDIDALIAATRSEQDTLAKLKVNHDAIAGQLRETTETLHALQKASREAASAHANREEELRVATLRNDGLARERDEHIQDKNKLKAQIEAFEAAAELPVVTGLHMEPTANVGKVTAWTLCLDAVANGEEVVLSMRTLAASAKSRRLLEADGEEFARVLDVPFKDSGLK